jgi:PAS domain S-box-containing protein
MEQHKLLQKQIKKFLTDDCLDNPLLKNFINAINDSYFSFERDKEIMNHAFQESEKEYQTINNSLKSEYELKKQSIANLYDSLDLIDENYAAIHVDDDADDLLFISKYLNQQVEKQKKNETAINLLVLMQQLLMEIATNYINIPAEKINETKSHTLQRLARFVSADRAYIFEYDYQNKTCSNTFEWCNEGIEPQLENLQNIPFEVMKDWVDSNSKGETMSIPVVEDLPEGELKQILSDQHIKSLLVLPIMGKNECIGFVGFDSVKNHYNYANKEKDLLLFFAQMIANVEERNKIELDLKHNIELLKTLLANFQSGILVEDENKKILFTNQLFCDLFEIPVLPDDLIGADCTNSAEQAKDLFKDTENFPSRIFEILHDRHIVTNENLEMKNGKFLERDYIPLYVNDLYKGHLWKYTDITYRVKSQILLEQSEERNRLIMNSALNAIINIDSNGIITFWNKQAEHIFGWKKEEVLGKALQDTIIPSQHTNGHLDGMKHYNETGEGPVLNKLLELPATKKDGTEFTIEIAIIPIKQNGELFFCSFIQDISERKKAENQLKYQEKKYRNIIANMNLGLIEVDSNDLIQFANQSFCKISGFDRDELIGKNPTSVFVDDENKKIIDSKKELRSQGKSDIYQIPVINKKGESRWWAISGAPNYDENGVLIGTIGIHLDITEQKQLEIELEIEKEKALEASKAKEIFLATMSHEIRTPLNAIIGFLRELKKQPLSDEQKKYIENSSLASLHLLSIINNVLDISKIEAGEMELETIDFELEKSIRKVTSILEAKAKAKVLAMQVIFSPTISKVLKGDAFRIEQILFNLVGNSLKFTNIGSITVQCDLIQEYENKQIVSIAIIDTGIGMDQSYLNTIFTKFSQEEKNTTRKFGGTGLGMTITKELVELMNGEISIESEKNVGTTIKIKLTLEKGFMNNNTSEQSNTSDFSLENIKVLLVEDNEFNRIVAQNSLKYFKCEVIEAINGLEAVEVLKTQHFDVILMDVQMPVMDGIEATTIIRNELKNSIPIIALTANAFKTEIEKFKLAGINDYITKPFDEDVLYKTIYKVIHHQNGIVEEKENEKLSYDLSSIITISRGDNDFVQKMIDIFIEQTIEVCNEIENCIAVNNFIEISRLIHKIKPNIEGMGINSIYDEVRELERICENSDDKEKIQLLFTIVKNTLMAAVIELKKIKLS